MKTGLYRMVQNNLRSLNYVQGHLVTMFHLPYYILKKKNLPKWILLRCRSKESEEKCKKRRKKAIYAKSMAVLLLFFIQQLRLSYASDLLWKIKWDRFQCRCVLEACSGTLSWISASFWYQILETEFLQKLTGEFPSDYEWYFWMIRKHDWAFADRILNLHWWYTE